MPGASLLAASSPPLGDKCRLGGRALGPLVLKGTSADGKLTAHLPVLLSWMSADQGDGPWLLLSSRVCAPMSHSGGVPRAHDGHQPGLLGGFQWAGTPPCTALSVVAIPVMDPADVLTLPFWSCLAGRPRQIHDAI